MGVPPRGRLTIFMGKIFFSDRYADGWMNEWRDKQIQYTHIFFVKCRCKNILLILLSLFAFASQIKQKLLLVKSNKKTKLRHSTCSKNA